MRHISRLLLACGALLLTSCADGREPLLTDVGQPVLAVAPAGATTQIFSGDRQAAVVGDTLPDLNVVQVLKADGSPAKGVTVTWSISSGGGTLVVASGYTNATGRAYARWKLGSLVGYQTLVATTAGAGSVTFNARGIPANSTLAPVSGNGQTAAADSALAQPLVLRVQDPTGTAIEGARVTWTVVAGGGRLDSLTSTTGADGQATGRWTLGSVPGEQRVRATVRGLAPLEFTATAASAGVTLTIYGGNGQTGTQYDTLTQNLVVRVARADGTPIEGVTVTWATPGQYSGMKFARTVTNSTGRAYNLWRLGKALGTQTATATVAGVGTVTFSATVVLNGRTLSVVSGSGQHGLPGDTLPQPLVMRAVDGTGRGIRGVKVTWTAVNGGTLDSAITYTDADGRARNRWVLGSRREGQQARAVVTNSGEVVFTATADPITGPQIVYRSNRVGSSSLFLISPDGTHRYPIYSGVPAIEPDWSPDGTQIVFRNPQTNALWVINADGSGARTLRAGLSPAWSPSGDRIAFSGSGPSGTGLYLVNPDGTGLTFLRSGATEPVWSPDGSRILFKSQSGDGIINADGTSFVPFAVGASPAWSPDGTRIAYHTSNPDCACDEGLIWVKPLAGGPAVQLGRGSEPEWSPDGTQIAYVSYYEYNRYHALEVMNADGTNRRVLDNGYSIYGPSWKPAP